jgi:hypothetical protein
MIKLSQGHTNLLIDNVKPLRETTIRREFKFSLGAITILDIEYSLADILGSIDPLRFDRLLEGFIESELESDNWISANDEIYVREDVEAVIGKLI